MYSLIVLKYLGYKIPWIFIFIPAIFWLLSLLFTKFITKIILNRMDKKHKNKMKETEENDVLKRADKFFEEQRKHEVE